MDVPKCLLNWVGSLRVNGRLAAIPEPMTMLLLGLGLVGIAGIRRTLKK